MKEILVAVGVVAVAVFGVGHFWEGGPHQAKPEAATETLVASTGLSHNDDPIPEWKIEIAASEFSSSVISLALKEESVDLHRYYLSRREKPGDVELARLDLEDAIKNRDKARQDFDVSKSKLDELVVKLSDNNQTNSASYIDNFITSSESWLSKVNSQKRYAIQILKTQGVSELYRKLNAEAQELSNKPPHY